LANYGGRTVTGLGVSPKASNKAVNEHPGSLSQQLLIKAILVLSALWELSKTEKEICTTLLAPC